MRLWPSSPARVLDLSWYWSHSSLARSGSMEMPNSPGASSCSSWPAGVSPNSVGSRSCSATSQTIVRFPARAAPSPRAAATVVLPTPPLPVTTTRRLSNSSGIGRKREGFTRARANRHFVTVIAFTNQKGGVAKTTTTLNLAAAFVESGHRTLCFDLDPQANLTMSQGIDPDSLETSMYDVLVSHLPIREVIRKREVDLAGAEIAMSTQIGRERSLQKALDPVMEEYDFVCIDTPPSLGLLTINALTAAQKVIVPVQCEYLSMRGLI